jgi:hypothetical protein
MDDLSECPPPSAVPPETRAEKMAREGRERLRRAHPQRLPIDVPENDRLARSEIHETQSIPLEDDSDVPPISNEDADASSQTPDDATSPFDSPAGPNHDGEDDNTPREEDPCDSCAHEAEHNGNPPSNPADSDAPFGQSRQSDAGGSSGSVEPKSNALAEILHVIRNELNQLRSQIGDNQARTNQQPYQIRQALVNEQVCPCLRQPDTSTRNPAPGIPMAHGRSREVYRDIGMQPLPPPAEAPTTYRTPTRIWETTLDQLTQEERPASVPLTILLRRREQQHLRSNRTSCSSRVSPSGSNSPAKCHPLGATLNDRSAPQIPIVQSARPASVTPPTPIATTNVYQPPADKRPPDLEESSDNERSIGEKEEYEADEPLTIEERERGKRKNTKWNEHRDWIGKGSDRRDDGGSGLSSVTGQTGSMRLWRMMIG